MMVLSWSKTLHNVTFAICGSRTSLRGSTMWSVIVAALQKTWDWDEKEQVRSDSAGHFLCFSLQVSWGAHMSQIAFRYQLVLLIITRLITPLVPPVRVEKIYLCKQFPERWRFQIRTAVSSQPGALRSVFPLIFSPHLEFVEYAE